MKLRVKLFAVARQRMGRDAIDVELPAAATVGQLRSGIAEQYPSLADLLSHVRFAIDSEYAVEGSSVPNHSEVAMIPPVSGG
jgi:molybdopterin converting factor subunit 1